MVIIRSFFVLDIYPKNGGPGGSRTRVRNSLSLSHSQACLIISPISRIFTVHSPLRDRELDWWDNSFSADPTAKVSLG